MALLTKFNTFVANVANGVHNLGSDTLKLMLTDHAPSVGNTIISNVTEITTGNGYTAGGATVPIASSAQSSGVYKLIPASSPTWTASGGAIAQFRYVVLYNATSGALIGWWDIGREVNLTVGTPFTPSLDNVNGMLQLS